MNLSNRLLSFVVLLSGIGFAQSDTARISGFIKDKSGAGIPGAMVSVRNENTAVERRIVTSETGYYVIPSLASGLYTVTVEATGFRRFQQTGNKLDPDIATAVDVELEVGAIELEVVDAAAREPAESRTAAGAGFPVPHAPTSTTASRATASGPAIRRRRPRISCGRGRSRPLRGHRSPTPRSRDRPGRYRRGST